MRRSLKIYVKIIAVYQTKKTSLFLPHKDKIPDLVKPMLCMNFHALDAVILIQAKLNAL